MQTMNKLTEITYQELLDLLTESFLNGMSSYSDLAEIKCQEILNKFVNKKIDPKIVNFGLNTTVTTSNTNIDWNNEQLFNMHTFLTNVTTS